MSRRRPRGDRRRRRPGTVSPRRSPLRRSALTAVVLLAVAVLLAAGIGGGVIFAVGRGLPDVTGVYTPPSQTSRIYAANGELIASLYRENRKTIALVEIPMHTRKAVLAIEDARFYQHRGVDVVGIARAAWRNLRAGGVREGGSTITQQLARTLFLTPERVLSRKLAEIVLALEIERRLTKDEILERYLNEVYFGEGAYGIEMAARVYFGKRAKALTVAEGALLAGLIRAPSAYSPQRNPALARARQRTVLDRMSTLGMITATQAAAARRQPLSFKTTTDAGLVGIRGPYFASFVLRSLLDLYGEELVYRGGLEVTTTLDTRMQALAEKAVRQGVDRGLERKLRTSQGALVAVDPRNGHVKAMIGGYDYRKSQFNRAWQARRQPGSSFKPFIYTTALANGVRPNRVLKDAPVSYNSGAAKRWRPKNYDGRYRGSITLRRAVEQSINIPAVRMLNELGPDRVIEYAKRMGIKSPLRSNLSLALGTSEVTVLEMASAYGVLANLGLRVEPMAILKVSDAAGKVLYESRPKREFVLTPTVSYLMTDILKGVITRGTGRRAANIGRPAAGKTGTTDDYRNAWFIGFTPHLSTAVWVGNDDNSPMRRVVGGGVPAEIWAAFMKGALVATPKDDWGRPDGLIRRGSEWFIRGTEPTIEEAATSTENENGAATDTGVVVESPADGAQIKTPFVIQGITAPGATVSITIVADGGILTVKLVETYLPTDDRGRFSYSFAPAVPIPGMRYMITLTATLPGRGSVIRTLAVTEAGP